jgi:hypothetical protein
MKASVVFVSGIASGVLAMLVAPFLLGEIDFRRVARGDEPLFARLEAVASDGGTALYHGLGYRLTSVHSLSHEADGVEMCVVGPNIGYYMPIRLIEVHRDERYHRC